MSEFRTQPIDADSPQLWREFDTLPAKPEVHDICIAAADAEAIANGSAVALRIEDIGVLHVRKVQEHPERDGHTASGIIETPEGDHRDGRAYMFKRSLVGKLLRRQVKANVWLGVYRETDA